MVLNENAINPLTGNFFVLSAVSRGFAPWAKSIGGKRKKMIKNIENKRHGRIAEL